MGLPNLPSSSEGIFSCFLGNSVFPISIFKGLVKIILHIIGINLSSSSSSETSSPTTATSQYRPGSFEFLVNYCSNTYIEEIRNQTPTLRFDSVCCQQQAEVECIVCLTQFEPESEINHLSCGHIFHKVCLDKWLNYWNSTCPLCRAPLMPEVEDETLCF